MADLYVITERAGAGMEQALEQLRACGERDLANALASVCKRWQTVVDKHVEAKQAALIANAKAETERAQRNVLSVELPIRTFSEANLHDHHMQRHMRMGDQRPVTCMAMASHANSRGIKVRPPCGVRLVRIAPAELDDDNLRGALKAVRDGVADWLKTNDRNPLVTWQYGQTKHGLQWGVLIEVSREAL